MYNEIEGNLIKLALLGKFDVIAHGCNCFCIMGAGLAPQMAKAFGCDTFPLESKDQKGNYNKLGQIDYKTFNLENDDPDEILIVVNAYTQFGTFGRKNGNIDLDYTALRMCFNKMNHNFAGYHIGLPLIGCNLAGGDWELVKQIIKEEFTNCDVTIVHYDEN